MTIDCPNCSARYNIQDSLIPAQGARVKCRKCATVITIPAPVVELAPQDLELIPPPGPAVSTKVPAPSASAPAPRSAMPTPTVPPPPPPPEPPVPSEQPAEAPGQGMDLGIVIDRPFEGTQNIPPADPDFERAGVPTRFGSPPSFSDSAAPASRERLAGIDTSMAMSSPSVAAEEPPAPILAPEPPPRAAAPSEAPLAAPTSPAPTGAAIPAGLSADDQSKHEKARRLARVLASDIAIYNRDKKERGIKEGNLVAMLGYEIKKSWEVYKERVGSDFANSTPYFRDALNEMLAEGKKIF